MGFVHGPERHLVRCDNPVAFGGKADMTRTLQNGR